MTQMSTSSFIQPEVLETPLDLGTGEIQTVFAVEANVSELFVYPNTHQTSILVPWSHWAQEIIPDVKCQKRQLFPIVF